MNLMKYRALLLGSDTKLAEAVAAVVRLDGGGIGFAANFSDAGRVMESHPPDLVFSKPECK